MNDDLLSIVVIVGIILTFLPQQVRIIRKKSSLGLSPYFMLLGITSVLSQLFNILLMQIPVFDECRNKDPDCFSDLLGIIQVVVLTLCLAVNFSLFLFYYPRPWYRSTTTEGKKVTFSVYVFFAFLAFCGTLLGITFGTTRDTHSPTVRVVGQFFGIFCTVLSCVQYIPQILRTWLTKKVGALSAATLAIQAPGSFFFAYTIATKPGTDVTTWGSFFISGTFQFFLVLICIYLNKYEDQGEEEETEPLITA